MFGIGMPELLVILVVALLVVGPKKLPDLAKSLGKGMREFRKATDEIKDSLSENESFKDLQNLRSDFKDTVDSMKMENVLDVENVLEPKEPKTNIEERQTVLDELAKDQPPADAAAESGAEAAAESDAEAAEAPPEATSQAAAEAGAPPEETSTEKQDSERPKTDG